MKIRAGASVIAMAMACGLMAVSSASAETLTDELAGLLDIHPQLQAARKTVDSAAEGINAARAGYLPTVKLFGDSGSEWIKNPTRNSTNGGEAYFRGRENATATVTQKLFDGYATDSAVETARLSEAIAKATLDTTRQAVLFEAVSAYIDIKRQNALVSLGRESEKNIQEQLRLEDERVKRGSGVAVDVLRSKQRLQVAKERRVAFEGGLRNAVTRYTQVFGHAPNIAGLENVEPPSALLPKTMEEAAAIAVAENPQIKAANLAINLSSERRTTAEAGYYPTLDLVGKGEYENDKAGTIGVKRAWSMLLQANWEIFSGFRTDAQVAQAIHDGAAAEKTRDQAARKVSEAVSVAWQTMRTARERQGLLQNAVNIAYEMWEATKKQREAGKADVMTVLDSESAIYDSRINHTLAFYDYRLSMFQVIQTMGRLEVEALADAAPAPKPKTAPAKTSATPPVAPAPAAPIAETQPQQAPPLAQYRPLAPGAAFEPQPVTFE